MSIEDIIAALQSSDRADLATIRTYIDWIKIRRRVHRRFYFRAHWIYHQKAPPILEGPRPVFRTHAGNAHWL